MLFAYHALGSPFLVDQLSFSSQYTLQSSNEALCAQAEPLIPQAFDVSSVVRGQEMRIINWLSNGIKIPTEIYDEMGLVGEDPHWEPFYQFADCRSSLETCPCEDDIQQIWRVLSPRCESSTEGGIVHRPDVKQTC